MRPRDPGIPSVGRSTAGRGLRLTYQPRPGEFEHLVRRVFEAMGMQGWTTTSSKDDGVEAVVKNPDPFVGGVTIIQAKHYKNVVGQNLTFLIKKYVGKEVVISVKRPKNAASIDQPDLPEG